MAINDHILRHARVWIALLTAATLLDGLFIAKYQLVRVWITGVEKFYSDLSPSVFNPTWISALVAVLAYLITRRQLYVARYNSTMALLNEWRRELGASQEYIINHIAERVATEDGFRERGYEFLADEARQHVVRVSHFFDYVGWVLKSGNLDKELFLTVIGPRVIQYWSILRHNIYSERAYRLRTEEAITIRGIPFGLYQAGFEYLANITWREYRRSYLQFSRADFDVPVYRRNPTKRTIQEESF